MVRTIQIKKKEFGQNIPVGAVTGRAAEWKRINIITCRISDGNVEWSKLERSKWRLN
jgi:hypothetical protein